MKLFIDNVPNLVTEVAIVAPLPELFQPRDVLQMSEKDLLAITAESKDTKARREELISELAVLLDGAKTCKEYATYQNKSTSNPSLSRKARCLIKLVNDARYERAHVETTEDEALLSEVSDNESARSSYVIDDATPPSPPISSKRPRRRTLASVSPPSTPAPSNVPLLVKEVLIEEASQPVEVESWGTLGSLDRSSKEESSKKKGKKDKKAKKASLVGWDEELRMASDEDGWPAPEPPPPRPETAAPIVAESWGFPKKVPAPALESGWDLEREYAVAATEGLSELTFDHGKKSKKKGKRTASQFEIEALEV